MLEECQTLLDNISDGLNADDIDESEYEDLHTNLKNVKDQIPLF